MSLRLSRRLSKLQPSATIALIGRIAKLRAEGVPVISFGQGESDFPAPEPIKAAAMAAVEKNQTRYTPAGGIPELRRAIAQQVERDTGIPYTPSQVAVTAGAKEALFLTFLATCDEGDEVIIPAPYWVSYIEQVRLAGATPVIVNTNQQTGYKVTSDLLAAHLSARTRAIVLNSPSNPTGAVYTAEELSALAKVIADTQALVITDEIYDRICYKPYARWLRVAPEMANRTIVINGPSKTFAVTGWRIGYAAGPEPLIKAIVDIQSHSTTHPASLAQYAALAAYTPSEELDRIVAEREAIFRQRRDLVVQTLQAIPGVSCLVPDGAFYVFPDVSGLLNRPLNQGVVCRNSNELAFYLLDHAHIGVVAGEAFGDDRAIRLSFAQDEESIKEGLRRFAEAVS